jgi:hypothetical protein
MVDPSVQGEVSQHHGCQLHWLLGDWLVTQGREREVRRKEEARLAIRQSQSREHSKDATSQNLHSKVSASIGLRTCCMTILMCHVDLFPLP